ncbi:hypothetical protein [Nocardia sp. NRRL S-836]|uniref:hypothetical protein n=1 Tax=Nocardia sp. NRRL S-836 TaxID=1519492 RepID=UPI0006AEAFB2|nr:hypothetical protein [Nocardia sp. NRRL S-836]
MSTEPQQPAGVAVAAAVVEPESPVIPVAPAEAAAAAPVTRKLAAGAAPVVVETSTATGEEKTGRVSRPMVVAAAVAGAVLVVLPVAFGTLSGDSGPGSGPNNAGYAQVPSPDGGFVPGLAAPQTENGNEGVTPPNGSVPGKNGDGTASGDLAGQTVPGPPGTPGQPVVPGQQPPPAQNQNQQGNPQAPPPAKPVTYEATAGPGCGSGTRFDGVGMYRDGKEGWVDHGGGCGSAFTSIPMSGDAAKDDPSAYGLWTFNTGPVTAGTCTVSVFVPNGDITAVGGSPTYYRVFDRFEVAKGTPVGSFQVSQVANRGGWVTVGSFKVNGAKLAVQLLTRGRDWDGSKRTYAHHAAGAVKAKCQA